MADRTIDQFCIFELVRCADLESAVRQHIGEPDNRVERRAELVTYGADEATPGRAPPLGFEAGRLQGLFLGLSRTNIAEDRDDISLNFFTPGRYAFQGPAPHFNPDKLASTARAHISLDTKFKRAFVTKACRSGDGSQESRPITDMHVLKKLVACKFRSRNAKQRLRRWRSKNDRTTFAATDDNVRHVADQKLIAIFLFTKKLRTCANERNGTKRQTRRIWQGRHNFERGKRLMHTRAVWPDKPGHAEDQQQQTRAYWKRRRKRTDPAGSGKPCFRGPDDEPKRRK